MALGPVRPAQAFTSSLLVDSLLTDRDDDDFSLLSWSTYIPNSSAIAAVRHRLRTGDMTVRFQNRPGSPEYFFSNVPRELYRQWKRVNSAGKFYHRRIKNQFFTGDPPVL